MTNKNVTKWTLVVVFIGLIIAYFNWVTTYNQVNTEYHDKMVQACKEEGLVYSQEGCI